MPQLAQATGNEVQARTFSPCHAGTALSRWLILLLLTVWLTWGLGRKKK